MRSCCWRATRTPGWNTANSSSARPAATKGTTALPSFVYVGTSATAESNAVQAHNIATVRRGP